MANQPESVVYDAGVYEWETTDPVQGGVGGVANAPLLNLANRTAWLKQRVDSLIAGSLIPPTVAPLNGPAFTGSATAPNVAPGDNSTLIANTNFVQTARGGLVVVPVPGSNTVTLTQPQWGVAIIVATGQISAAASLIFPSQTGAWIVHNLTTGAFPLVAKTAAQAGVTIPQGGSLAIYCDGTSIFQQTIILTGKGEVTSADLAPTGISPGAYPKANVTVGADGRISGATAGTISFSEVTTALGFTPVQQGGGASQGNNKLFIGWDNNNAVAPRLQVDGVDQGQFIMRNSSLLSGGAGLFLMQWAAQQGTSFFLQFGGVAIPTPGGGPSEVTVNLNWAFPSTCLGSFVCFGGNTPPLGASISTRPFNRSQIGVTANSTDPATLGVNYLAWGF